MTPSSNMGNDSRRSHSRRSTRLAHTGRGGRRQTPAIDAELEEQIQRYEDFTTIDSIQDSILERNRRLRNERAIGRPGRFGGKLWTQLRRAVNATQSWVVVALVGVCIGIDAALISIVTEWLSDLKMGYCSDGWWLNQQFCCWEIEADSEETDHACDSWRPWSTVLIARWLVYVLFAISFAFTASHLVRSLAKYAAGSGISEIKCILAGFVMQGYLGFATLAVKSITLPLVIASGLSVGKEGPSVHVACCVGWLVAGLFERFRRSHGKMREIVTAASAAGVAVAFGAPIGGVLFSIEEMGHTFSIKTMWRSFFCALMATFTLSAMNPFRTGKLVLFQVTYDRDWHFFEIMFFVILGVFGGLYGALVVKFNVQVAAFRRKHLANHGVAEAVILAMITALIGYGNKFMRIDMTESMAILFRECDNSAGALCQTSMQWRIVNSLLLATVVRTGLVILSYGAKVPAGIFIPSMAIGATFGRMVGITVRAIYRAHPKSGIFAFCAPDLPCITPGTYAFLGAAATLSGVMRITVTVVVIMFELTGALTYILPTMIVVLVTKAVGDFMGTRGIADEFIRFNGYPFLEKEDHAYNDTVSSVMRTDLHTIVDTGMTVQELDVLLASTAVKSFPVVTQERLLQGLIGRTELRYVLDRARQHHRVVPETLCTFLAEPEDASVTELHGQSYDIDEDLPSSMFGGATQQTFNLWPWVNRTSMPVSPQLPLEIVLQIFKQLGPRIVLVEDRGRLVGLVTIKDVLRFVATGRPSEEHSELDVRGSLAALLETVWGSCDAALSADDVIGTFGYASV
ncbi:voltage-gated chloride channel [Fistulina hepatica ATCC 64428]|uniref:Chloride channel protein n=1 Tax=Fistulina hepatica ATCC 64428 TaxID=1128425 RepID=A0A0D7ADU6_9AGAR|nr:voltage-gated chloride channel [Fistulina hepatica ATCC 64428]